MAAPGKEYRETQPPQERSTTGLRASGWSPWESCLYGCSPGGGLGQAPGSTPAGVCVHFRRSRGAACLHAHAHAPLSFLPLARVRATTIHSRGPVRAERWLGCAGTFISTCLVHRREARGAGGVLLPRHFRPQPERTRWSTTPRPCSRALLNHVCPHQQQQLRLSHILNQYFPVSAADRIIGEF